MISKIIVSEFEKNVHHMPSCSGRGGGVAVVIYRIPPSKANKLTKILT